jgi:hypothetical protein
MPPVGVQWRLASTVCAGSRSASTSTISETTSDDAVPTTPTAAGPPGNLRETNSPMTAASAGNAGISQA